MNKEVSTRKLPAARSRSKRADAVLVTGATGVVGANLVRRLLQEGFQVRALVRPTSDVRALTTPYKLDVDLIHGDLLDDSTLSSATHGCRFVFHAGTPYTYWGISPEELKHVAVQGTVNALNAAANAGVERFILTSSSVTLGFSTRKHVLSEGAPVQDPSLSASPYVTSKVLQEEAAHNRASELGIPIVTVCPTITLGAFDPRLSASNAIVVNYLKDPLKATFPGGCNVVSAMDVANGHVLAALYGEPGLRYVLAGENIEWPALHRKISELCGIPGPSLVANHTACFLGAVAQEAISRFTGHVPVTTRDQARMVGRYYWYSYDRAAAIGYQPRSARQTLAEALSWLVTTEHVPMAVRRSLRVTAEVYRARKCWDYPVAQREMG